MPSPTPPAVVSAALLLATALTACGAEDPDDVDDGTDESVLVGALSRVGADDGTPGFIAFSDQRTLEELPDEQWETTMFAGAPDRSADAPQLSERLGIDIAGADTLLTVGHPPANLILVTGGQDAAAIDDAATSAGWTGDDVLTHEPDVTEPLSVAAPQLRTIEDSVVIGGPSADLTTVDTSGESLAEDATVSALTACLGDVPVAMFEPADDAPVAVGVRPDPDSETGVQSVLCALGDDAEALGDGYVDAFASGNIPTTGDPYTDSFEDPIASTDGDTVQVLLTNTDSALPATIIQMLIRRDLPTSSD